VSAIRGLFVIVLIVGSLVGGKHWLASNAQSTSTAPPIKLPETPEEKQRHHEAERQSWLKRLAAKGTTELQAENRERLRRARAKKKAEEERERASSDQQPTPNNVGSTPGSSGATEELHESYDERRKAEEYVNKLQQEENTEKIGRILEHAER
jgi:hypothetical protein